MRTGDTVVIIVALGTVCYLGTLAMKYNYGKEFFEFLSTAVTDTPMIED